MRQEQPNDAVTVLIAYHDRSRRSPMGPALILFGRPGAASAAVLVERPWSPERAGYHGAPASFVGRFSACRPPGTAAVGEWHSPPRAG